MRGRQTGKGRLFKQRLLQSRRQVPRGTWKSYRGRGYASEGCPALSPESGSLLEWWPRARALGAGRQGGGGVRARPRGKGAGRGCGR